jgi:regulator of protease activity HflC (stomatin/prohibitin superfamily)
MKLIISVAGILLVALIATSIGLIIGGAETHGVNTGWILLAFIVAYLIFSFGTVKVNEVAMMAVFDKPIGNIGKGLYFAPAGIVSVQTEVGTVFQDELPADPEKIFRLPEGSRDDGKIPEGMFPPIRVKFGQPGPTNITNPDPVDLKLKDDPYNVAMVAEVVPVVSWRINDATMFFRVMGDVKNCRQILADKAVELFGDEFANVTPAKAALTLNATSQKLEDMLVTESKAKEWGIEIRDAYVKPFIFTHALNTSVIGVSIAQQNAKAAVHTAEGTAKAVEIAAGAERERLLKTGLAKTGTDDNIELVPDATTKAHTDALKELAKVTGTLVLGDSVTPVVNIKKEKG